MAKDLTARSERKKEAGRLPGGGELIVPPESPAGRLIVPPGTPAGMWPTNLPTDTPRGRATVLNAMTTADLQLHGEALCPVLLKHYLAYPTEVVDPDTGEVHQVSRLVLIQPDGTTFATTSPVVAHRLADLIDLFGPGPWEPAMPVAVFLRRSVKSGRHYHDLRIILESMP